MTAKPVHDEACQAEAGHNAVIVNGPSGIEVVLSPRAALETAKNLEEAAVDSIVTHATSASRD